MVWSIRVGARASKPARRALVNRAACGVSALRASIPGASPADAGSKRMALSSHGMPGWFDDWPSVLRPRMMLATRQLARRFMCCPVSRWTQRRGYRHRHRMFDHDVGSVGRWLIFGGRTMSFYGFYRLRCHLVSACLTSGQSAAIVRLSVFEITVGRSSKVAPVAGTGT